MADVDIELDLPVPPTANHIWQSGRKGVFRTKQYKEWQRQADALTLSQRGWRNKRIEGRFTALLVLNERMLNPASDGDNRMKVPLDYAKRLGLIVDDSVQYCRGGRWSLGGDESAPCGARLILRAAD